MLTPIETPRAFAVDEFDALGRLARRIKVFEPEDRQKAIKLVYRLNNPPEWRNGSTCGTECEAH